ncbi:MAG: 2-oxoglutarate dehydrogenase, E2 component, dihydrolipoamide succinyltransferase [Angustibacter sp.]
MSERVKMPALGESVTEGTVTRWLKQVGEQVEVDEPLLEVSTDKVDTEIPSPVAGTLQEVLVGEDETVPVGADLAVIGDGAAADGGADGGEQAPQEQPQQAAEQATEQPSEQVAEPSAAQEPDATTSEPEAQSQQSQEQAQDQAQDQPQEQPQGGSGDAGGTGGGTTVTMPALGESVTEGTVTRWLKAEGDTVEVDEPLLEVSTDKVDTEIPSPAAGTITKLLVAEDETVPVGADLAVIGGGAPSAAAESPAQPQQQEQTPAAQEAEHDQQQAAQASSEPEAAPEESNSTAAETQTPQPTAAPTPPAAAAQPAPAAPAAQPAQASAPSSDASTYVTPLVRKLAAEHGVDLSSISGTGVGGRVRKQDVLDAAEAAKQAAATPEPAPAAAPAAAPARPSAPVPASVSAKRGTTEKMTRLRRLIAQRMVESLQTSAQLTTVIEVDVTKIARLRDRAKNDFAAREGVKLSFLPFFAQAAVEALKAHPTVNASIEGDEVVYHAQENLGIAVDTDKGLIVPVIRDAGDLNIAGIARKISDLAERTRANKIAPDELGGGTFTLTNTGSRGALFDTPIINQPQVAILGTGTVVKRAVVIDDANLGETIAVRRMVYLALTYDHRIVDGADAARFLVAVKNRLEGGNFESNLGI